MEPRLFLDFEKYVRAIYHDEHILLHRPVFSQSDEQCVLACLKSNFVSSAGPEVGLFEKQMAEFTESKYAVATVSGTAALHACLAVIGIGFGDEVITPSLTFVATGNAVKYCGAEPVFLDVEPTTGTISPEALRRFLSNETTYVNGKLLNKSTKRPIKACIVMHTFGHPARLTELSEICKNFDIDLIEDAAEALGSRINDRHVGNAGILSIYSFNGNKIITTGGGGMITSNDEELATKLRHITTTAKVPHQYNYFHDQLGFNYRLPNLNASLGLGQMKYLQKFLAAKRKVAKLYDDFFKETPVRFWSEEPGAVSNYWLNAISFPDKELKHAFLDFANSRGIMTRPVWDLLPTLPHFKHSQTDGIPVARDIFETTVNIPSSVPNN